MSSSCRVDSNYRFGRLTFDPTAGRIRFGLARVSGAQSFGVLKVGFAEADIGGPHSINLDREYLLLALNGHAAMSDLSPQCASKRTSGSLSMV
jgi:hypothetical protein